MNVAKAAERIGEIVRFHRKQGKLTQLDLAKLAGVGKVAVFDLEHGKSTFQIDTLLKILNALNIHIKFQSPLMEVFEKQRIEIK